MKLVKNLPCDICKTWILQFTMSLFCWGSLNPVPFTAPSNAGQDKLHEFTDYLVARCEGKAIALSKQKLAPDYLEIIGLV
jgi:hypothetical protein